MVKILKIGSPNHGVQWFLMVVHHRSNDAMVMVTYHCSSLSYSYYIVFLVSRNWRAVFVLNSFCTKFEEIINLQRLYIEMLQCGSNDEVIKGNLCSMNCENGNRSTSKNINVVKLHNLLYMMKIVMKSDAGMHGAAFFVSGWGGAGQGVKFSQFPNFHRLCLTEHFRFQIDYNDVSKRNCTLCTWKKT